MEREELPMTNQALMDKLDSLVQSRKHHIAMGREALAASYKAPIDETLVEIKRRGGDPLEWLEACEG
jgi:hypothetical protein